MDEDQPDDESAWRSQPNLTPVRAQDLLDEVGAQIVRGLVMSEDHEELRWSYGCSIEEARMKLSCRDLATLRMWDADCLADAATVVGSEEERVYWGMESRDAIARRISLAMGASGIPSLMTPADGILFLRRIDIPVYVELVDAVAVMVLRDEGDAAKFRELKRMAPAWLSEPAVESVDDGPTSSAHSPPLQQGASRSASSKQNWRDVVKPYVLRVLGSQPTLTGKGLFRALEAAADVDPDCPFEKGTGNNRGKLVVRLIPQAVSTHTVENWLGELKRSLPEA